MLSGQNFRRIVATAALSICMLVAARDADAGAWATDVKSGCRVWNPNPQLTETVTWSGACGHGLAEGSGTVQWLKGDVAIETDAGEWRDGRQAGKGTQAWGTGRYDGDLADGEPNGRGVLVLQNLRYEGEFRDSRPNGTGSLTAGGDTVQGVWKNGCLQGGQRKASIGIPLSACR